MKYELFGTNANGAVEYLGSYRNTEYVLKAMDEFMNLGYTRVRYTTWIQH